MSEFKHEKACDRGAEQLVCAKYEVYRADKGRVFKTMFLYLGNEEVILIPFERNESNLRILENRLQLFKGDNNL